MLLEELERVDDVLGVVVLERVVFFVGFLVVDKERCGEALEFDEVEEVDEDGAVTGGVGDFEEVDDGGDVGFLVDAGEDSKLRVGFDMWESSSVAFVAF